MGYDISDYESVYPPYGTVQDMETLIQKAHDRDMKIILTLSSTIRQISMPGSKSLDLRGTIRKEIGTSGDQPLTIAMVFVNLQITGEATSVALSGNGMSSPRNITFISSARNNLISTLPMRRPGKQSINQQWYLGSTRVLMASGSTLSTCIASQWTFPMHLS